MIEAILWSVIWTILVIIAVRVFPFTIEHDYPIEVRKVANVQHPTPKQKIQGILFGLVGFTIQFGLLILFAFIHFRDKELSFWSLFKYLWFICMTWNVVDLIVVDWLMICKLSVKLFVLPNTEKCNANKDYKFHFIGFLKGCVATTVIALFFSAISYGIIYFAK